VPLSEFTTTCGLLGFGYRSTMSMSQDLGSSRVVIGGEIKREQLGAQVLSRTKLIEVAVALFAFSLCL
jgi:hypothetical protein